MLIQGVIRGGAGILIGLLGWPLGLFIGERAGDPGYLPWGLALTLFGLVLGIFLVPYLLLRSVTRASRKLDRVPIAILILGVVGLLVGLVIAALLSVSLGSIPGTTGWVLPIAVSLALGGLGALVFATQGEALVERVPAMRHAIPQGRGSRNLIIMDTSAIIDGRIMDVVATGFLQGTLGIPNFILDELRHIADSSDFMRRNRGRRGLEILDQMRRDSPLPIQVLDGESQNEVEVDARLVLLAQQMGAAILTTDFNLNRVAEFQGVQVLNLNQLAYAVKPMVLPGEEMTVRMVQEGRESGQGVGFLDDGTMVVVEGGKKFINSHLDIAIIRVLQTAQGRIIFAQPKGLQ